MAVCDFFSITEKQNASVNNTVTRTFQRKTTNNSWSKFKCGHKILIMPLFNEETVTKIAVHYVGVDETAFTRLGVFTTPLSLQCSHY